MTLYECNHCGTQFRDGGKGKRLECPNCGSGNIATKEDE